MSDYHRNNSNVPCSECGEYNGAHDWDKHIGSGKIRIENNASGFLSVVIFLFGFFVAILCPPIGALIIALAAKIGNW